MLEKIDTDDLPEDDGDHGSQCNETHTPYRCVQSVGHTGKHVTWGIKDVEAWTRQYYSW